MRAVPDEWAELVVLDRADCLRLLRRGVIGRVVYTAGALPAAQPVGYAVRGEEIIFRTGEDSLLRAAAGNEVVAVEVDDGDSHGDLDGDIQMRWSVLAIGKAYRVIDADRLAELAAVVPRAWAPGPTVCTVAVPARLLTGRRVGRIDPVDP